MVWKQGVVMNLWQLVIKEIRHQRLSFCLGILAVIIAVGVLAAELTLLGAHDLQTQEILAAKEVQLKEEMAVMEDDYRKIMKILGFNLLILPEGQQLSDFYAEGYATKDMPEEYVERLSASNIVTIRHLLPSIEQKIRWPEQGMRSIILIGTRGEVPFTKRAPKEPILEAVPPDHIVLGYEIWNSLGFKVGDEVRLLGRDFTVSECHPQRGSKDDITVWIDLKQAQEMVGKQGRINAILALKCHCEGSGVESVRRNIADILPETKVIEFSSSVITRAEARDRAKETAEFVLSNEKDYRAKLRQGIEVFASWLVPLVILGCIVWIGFLAFGNVRERKGEIGILRALGLRSKQILFVFLAKAILIGLFGALVGYFIGFAVGLISGETAFGYNSVKALFNPFIFFLVMFTAPLLAGFASWVPALIAAKQDPADILRNE
ncbi:ABC transporter permease [candidate division KSB1 bacterium]